jgi:serine/threonine-protein kinase
LRDIGEERILIEAPDDEPLAQVPRSWRSGVVAILAVAVAVTALLLYRPTRTIPHPLVRIDAELAREPDGAFRLNSDTTLKEGYVGTFLALSPDGTHLAVSMRDADGKVRLATRRLDQSRFVPLSGTENPSSPFFSPNGQWIAFFAEGKLKKIPVQGGEPVTLCDAGNFASGSWGDDDSIIAALDRGGPGGLWRVPSAGGAPTPVTELNHRQGETAHLFPQVLPGSQSVLFTTSIGGGGPEEARIDVLSLKTREQKTVVHGGRYGRYLPSGHLVYLHQNTLLAISFDPRTLAVAGALQPVLDDVSTINFTSPGDFDFSRTGTFVYISGKGEPPRSIYWLDSSGNPQPLRQAPEFYEDLRLSPDGTHLAYAISEDLGRLGRQHVWVQDLARGTALPLTSLPSSNPVWTPDSKYVVFLSRNQPNAGIYWTRADGSGEPHRLTEDGGRLRPSCFSPDGKRLVLEGGDQPAIDVWTVPIEGNPDHPLMGKSEPFLRVPGFPLPAFSPDGRWLAYSSTETGTAEIYVRPFPGPGGKWRVSIGGGRFPIWSPNGHELFFLAPDRRIMVSDYTAKGGSFVPVATPHAWSAKQILLSRTAGPFPPYSLAPNGKRFAVVLYPDGTAEQKPITRLTFLLNFFDELQRRMPAGNK